jgi:ketosteroid isomerase-like protein
VGPEYRTPTSEVNEVADTAGAVVRRFVAAMGQDVDAMFGCLAPDFVRYGSETGWLPMARATYRRMAENFQVPFPDCRWEPTQVVVDGGRVAVELVESGTFLHPWTIRGVTVEPNSVHYEMHGATFFEVHDHELISSYRYVHTGSFTQTYADVMTDEFYGAYAEEFFGEDR